MCDSISVIAMIKSDLTDEDYAQCKYPATALSEAVPIHADFRPQFPRSPLTGAGFVITPLGLLVPGTTDSRFLHGRIAGYQVDINVPACAIGHNRSLVNGVPAAAYIAVWMLKWWLAMNGCTKEGLDRISYENVVIENATLTYLYEFDSEEAAREFQAEYRAHTEAVMNKGPKDGAARPPAFSFPKQRPADLDAKYTYTSYVRHREYKFSAYVKELNQANAWLLPLADDDLEAEVESMSERTFRLEVKIHGKWLKDNGLITISQWKEHLDPYKMVFGLVRELLRLDDGLRLRRLKKTSVASLDLSERAKKYVLYHLSKRVVRDHPDFRLMDKERGGNYYSALRLRVYRKIGLDFDIPYDVQIKQLSSRVTELLVYRGEFKPAEHLAGYLLSKVSLPAVLERLKTIVKSLVEYGPHKGTVPNKTIYNGPKRPKKPISGIAKLPVIADPEDRKL